MRKAVGERKRAWLVVRGIVLGVDQLDALDALAAEEQASRSAVVRRAVDELLRRAGRDAIRAGA